MARKARQKSVLGIYHVMLRGINKYNIFFDERDHIRMMEIIRDIPFKIDNATGKVVSSSLCTIYAYCILDNHVHLLIKEGELGISDIMKKIGDRYAVYCNKRYERIGHLFQSRFASEAINDSRYFFTVLRYIARNPVKAMESTTAEEYPYSSWNEYVDSKSNIMHVLKPGAIQAVIRKYPLQELSDWINEDNDDHCLDIDTLNDVKSDKEAWNILSGICKCINPEDFRRLDIQTQLYYIFDALSAGVKISQAARLASLTRYQIVKALEQRERVTPTSPNVVDSFSTGSVPVEKENVVDTMQFLHDKVRHISGLSKKSYHLLHLIVEYLGNHPVAKRGEIASYIGRGMEQTRRLLVLLANVGIININGQARNVEYSLKMW